MVGEDVDLRLNLKNRRDVAAGLHGVGSDLNRVGARARGAGRDARAGARGFDLMGKAGRTAGRGMRAGAVAGAAGMMGLAYWVGKGSQALMRVQTIGAQTNAVIKSTGGAANVTRRQVDGMAGRLEALTGIEAESITEGQNLLLTFTGIRDEAGKGNKIFSQATRTLVDMSVAMGKDSKGSAVMLGKALNDPLKGVTALTKVGVVFDDQQKKQIETLVESGQKMKAQKIILAELNREYGGSAKAFGQTDAGKIERFNNAMGNLQERLAGAAAPMLEDVTDYLIQDGIPTLEKWGDTFEKRGVPALRNLVREATPLAKEVLPALSSAMGTVRDIFREAAPYVRDTIAYFNDMPDWAKKAIVGGGLAGAAGLKLRNALGGGAPGRGGMASTLIGKAKPIPVFVTNPGFGAGRPGVAGGPAAAAAPGGKKMPPLLAAGGALAAGAAAAYTAPDVARTLFGNKNLEKAAEEFGFSMKKLTEDLQQNGRGGDYVRMVARMLDDEQRAWKDVLFAPNPAVTNNERAGKAESELKDLTAGFDFSGLDQLKVLQNVGGNGLFKWLDTDPFQPIAAGATRADKLTRNLIVTMGGAQAGTGKARDRASELGRVWGSLPRNVRTAVLTPGLVESRSDVRDLTSKFNGLDRRQVKTIMAVLGIPEARNQIDGLAKPRRTTLTIDIIRNINNVTDAIAPQLSVPRREAGGPVKRGQGYIVGEKRPEYFLPDTDGYIYPHVGRMRMPEPLSAGPRGQQSNAGSGSTIVVPVYLNGRQIAEAVWDEERDGEARG